MHNNLIEYLNNGYKITPIGINADISAAALNHALTLLEFTFETEFVLHLQRHDIEFLNKVLNNIFNIKVYIDETLTKFSWYVVNINTKQIIYSPGA